MHVATITKYHDIYLPFSSTGLQSVYSCHCSGSLRDSRTAVPELCHWSRSSIWCPTRASSCSYQFHSSQTAVRKVHSLHYDQTKLIVII